MHTNRPQDLSRPFDCVLVMPAYNEEGCIEQVVTRWIAKMRTHFGDRALCVVVNDGSRDRTGPILDTVAARDTQVRVIHQKNAGHGGALLRAYREALLLNPVYVFHVDSDDQFDPDDFDSLWERRSDSACILGCRVERHDALHRLVITRFLRLVLFMWLGVKLTDSNIPFRLMRSDFLSDALAVIPESVFAPNIFVAVVAARQGHELMHLPVKHVERKTGKVWIVRWKLVKVCWRCVRELLAFRKQFAQRKPGPMAATV